MRSQAEITDLWNRARSAPPDEERARGVRYTLEWLFGDRIDDPLPLDAEE